MRAYMRIFLNLLMPVSILITIGSMVYFSMDYDFSKSLKLGILTGVLIGFPLSLIASLVLLVTRRSKPAVQESESVVEHTNVNLEAAASNSKKPIEQSLMLLMDKKLAFDVALFSILDQNIGEATTKESKEKCTITVRTSDETIQIITTALTRHTAQIVLKAAQNSPALQEVITYIKQKEHAFLQA